MAQYVVLLVYVQVVILALMVCVCKTGLEIFVVDVDVDVVGMVDFVDVFVVIGYWLFDVGVQIVITDSSGNAIEGIPVNIKVIPQNFLSGTKTIR